MTIIALPSDPIIVDGAVPGVAYRLERPSVARKTRFRAEVTRLGGRQWTIGDLLAGLDAAAEALLADDEPGRDAVKRLVQDQRNKLDGYLADVRERGEGWSWGDEARDQLLSVLRWPDVLEAFAAGVAMDHPRYAAMIADNSVYGLIRGTAAARVALLAIDGADDFPVIRRGGIVLDATLDRIPELDLVRIGEAFDAACSLATAQKKASPSPSGGASDPAPSTAASTTAPSDLGPATPGSSTPSAGAA